MSEKNEVCMRVYTAQDVADILKVHEMSVRRYIKEGKLRKLNTNGAIRIAHTDLDRFINGDKDE